MRQAVTPLHLAKSLPFGEYDGIFFSVNNCDNIWSMVPQLPSRKYFFMPQKSSLTLLILKRDFSLVVDFKSVSLPKCFESSRVATWERAKTLWRSECES